MRISFAFFYLMLLGFFDTGCHTVSLTGCQTLSSSRYHRIPSPGLEKPRATNKKPPDGVYFVLLMTLILGCISPATNTELLTESV